MRLIHTSLFAAIAALGLTACNKPADTDPRSHPGGQATAAQPTAEPPPSPAGHDQRSARQPRRHCRTGPDPGQRRQGHVTFSVVDGKVHVKGQVSGLKPNSEHGFHIHEKGDCSAPDGASAGGHFNPGKQDHGNVATDPHHGGDMPNIKADAQGNATIDARCPPTSTSARAMISTSSAAA